MIFSMAENANMKVSLGKFEETLNEWFVKKAPFQLPEGVKQFIVSFGPWITLVLLILTLPIVFAAIGLSAVFAPFAFLGGVRAGTTFGLTMIFALVYLVLEALALPGLFKRKRSGWNLIFYASILSAVENLVSFNLGGLVIGTVISWYFLFQIRSYYK